MITRQRARRRLVVLVVALVVGLGTVIGFALGDGNDERAASSTTTTAEPDDDPYLRAVAAGVIAASDGLVDEVQARCVAERLEDDLGRTELVRLGYEARRRGRLPADAEAQVLAAMVDCVPGRILEQIGERQDD